MLFVCFDNMKTGPSIGEIPTFYRVVEVSDKPWLIDDLQPSILTALAQHVDFHIIVIERL